MSDDIREDRFTIYKGDLQVTSKGQDNNPYGYSYSVEDGELVFYDDDGNPVNPAFRPITEADLAAAATAFKMDSRSAASLATLIERHMSAEKFADAVITKAAQRALEKI